jgi:archaellum biogenesis ATPase FlaH
MMSSWQEPSTNLMAFDKESLEKKLSDNTKFFLPETGMKFLDEHFGLRPGCIHTLMGSTGSGKSTLTQSLILKWGSSEDILVYLTEESQERFETKLFEKNQTESEALSPHVFLMHEKTVLRTHDAVNHRAMLQAIEKGINESKAKIVIIDNLTTSAFYDGNFNAAIPVLSGLRNMAEHYKIPIFIIVHTKKGVNENSKGLMDPDDVRGSANISNTSDYFYTFYRVGQSTGTGNKTWGSFIYVNKSRDHDTQGYMYSLQYQPRNKLYIGDSRIPFTVFKNFMKERDKL